MAKQKDISHSILIISSTEQFEMQVKKHLVGFLTIDVRKSCAAARRAILEQNYDIIVMRLPLPDDLGLDLALDAVEDSTASVLVEVPREIYEDVTDRLSDYGIMVMPSPSQMFQLDKALRYMKARQNVVHNLKQKLQKAQEKTEEVRIVSKAKLMLMEEKHMTEDDAHRFIGKTAMNNGISRRKAAEMIMEDLDS
ncbi:MAG: ANTAR domain-containing protein [Lachnospiraceae bacterium]|nr:ANTAR domain-containing protein [Lachnospiraceae bacterium]